MARDVLVHLFEDAPTGIVDAEARIKFTPTRIRESDGGFILPKGHDEDVPAGGITLPLDVTGPTWAYWVQISYPVGNTTGKLDWYVAVPEGEGVINLKDLPRIDKDTLEPSILPDPVWYALIEGIQAGMVDEEVLGVMVDADLDTKLPTRMVTEAEDETSPFRNALNTASVQAVKPSLDTLDAAKLDRVELVPELDQRVPPLVASSLATDGAPAAAAAAAAATAVDAQLGAIKPLFSRSTNLFIQDTAFWNLGFAPGSPTPAFSGTNGISDYIPVKEGAAYYFHGGISRVTWFDAAKAYLSDNGGITSATRTAPADAAYVRVSLPMASFGTAQMNEGTVLLPYEEGHSTQVTAAAVPRATSIAPDQTTFFTGSNNLFEVDTITPDAVISAGQGAVGSSAVNSVSDWIPIQSLQAYTYAGADSSILRVTYYDESRNHLGDYSFPVALPVTQGTPPRTRWARLSVNSLPESLGTVQMNEGTTALPYERGGWKIKAERLPATTGTPGESAVRPITDADISGLWQVAEPVPAASFISVSTPQTVYDAYDALVTAHPGYVSRTQPGTSTGGDFPIYAYTFRQPGPENTALGGAPVPRAKVVLVTGTHGNERASVWSTHEMVKRMCEDWETDPVLAALRYNLDLVVVPLSNPTGYRDNSRVTANGVDINRNWPTGWTLGTPGQSTYGGPSPLSEPETQAINAVLTANPDALGAIDFHNFHTPADDYQFLWGTAPNERTAEIHDALVRRMDRAWKADEPTIVNQDPAAFIGYVSYPAPGTFAQETGARGYPLATTFEMCWKVPTEPESPTYSSLTMTWGTEALVNLLTIALRNA